MSALAAHFRKECRDHRTGVVGFALMVLLTGIILCLALPDYWIEASLVSQLTLGALLAAVVLFAPDLSEQRQKTQGFVARLPHGLRVVIWSKVLFLLVVIGGLTCLAFATGVLLRAGIAEDWTDPVRGFNGDAWPFASHVMSVAFWLLAASFWLPRSTLCVPGVALLLLVIGLPAYVILDKMPPGVASQGYLIRSLDVMHPVFALTAAWLSCVRGRRSGRGPGASAWRGLSVAAVAGVLLTGMASVTYDEWFWYELRPEEFEISDARVGPDGRYAFLSVRARQTSRPRSVRALVVDLRQRTLKEFGGRARNAWFTPLEHREWAHWPGTGAASLLTCFTKTDLTKLGPHSVRVELVDTGTRQVLAELPLPLDEHRYGDFGAACHAELRARSALRLPDGRRCWSFRGAIMTEDREGVRTLVERSPEQRFAAFRWGFGFGLSDINSQRAGNAGKIYDLIRERVVDVSDRNWRRIIVLPEHWLVAEMQPDLNLRWSLFDPDTGALRPAPGMHECFEVGHVLGDGRVLVGVRGDRRGVPLSAGMWRVDTSNGELEQLFVECPSKTTSSGVLGAPVIIAVTPGGRLLARVHDHLTSLAPDSTTFTRPQLPGFRGIAAVESETAVIAIVHPNKLVRIDVETGEREQLFPFVTDQPTGESDK